MRKIRSDLTPDHQMRIIISAHSCPLCGSPIPRDKNAILCDRCSYNISMYMTSQRLASNSYA